MNSKMTFLLAGMLISIVLSMAWTLKGIALSLLHSQIAFRDITANVFEINFLEVFSAFSTSLIALILVGYLLWKELVDHEDRV